MKTIKSLLIIVMLFIGTISFAQSHNTTTGSNCKYAKNRCTNMEGCPQCAACSINDKKEKDAKAEEIKRRNEKIWADAKAKKDAEQKTYREKLAADEVKRKIESGDVVINDPKSADKKVVAPKKINTVDDNTIMIGNDVRGENFFENEKQEIIIKNEEWTRTQSIYHCSFSDNYPTNIGLVRIGDPNYYMKKSSFHMDLINSKGDYLLKDDDISDIDYIDDGWFLIGKWNNLNYLYNFKTQSKIDLEDFFNYETPLVNEKFFPIFPKTVKLNTAKNNTVNINKMNRLFYYCEDIKKNLIKFVPTKVNEEILSKYSFVLVHTDYSAKVLGNDREFAGRKRIVLLCMTKTGKLEKIELK